MDAAMLAWISPADGGSPGARPASKPSTIPVGVAPSHLRKRATASATPASETQARSSAEAAGSDDARSNARTMYGVSTSASRRITSAWIACISLKDARRVVVGVDQPARRRIHALRQLGERQNLVRRCLMWLRIAHGQPLVSALAVAHEPWRHAVDCISLQILAHRYLAGGEVGDVAVDVGIHEVLRTEIQALQ